MGVKTVRGENVTMIDFGLTTLLSIGFVVGIIVGFAVGCYLGFRYSFHRDIQNALEEKKQT